MTPAFRCPECGTPNPLFEAVNDGLLAIAAEPSLENVLQRIVDAARALVHSSYAALGVPDGRGRFAHFITSGMHADVIHALGAPPRCHGILGAMLTEAAPFGTANVQEDPRFLGWPEAHPELKSFLGVPIVEGDRIVAAFYLANENTWGFSRDDLEVVQLLAPHAGLAIKNAGLYERSRELSVIQERNRLARELHDSVTQQLFSMKLAAETAHTLMGSDSSAARSEIAKLKELARAAMAEMRALIFELRPPELETEGLIATLRKHVEVLRRVHRVPIHLHAHGSHAPGGREETELFRIVQEALNNALKHSAAAEISIEVVLEQDKTRLTVTDDGQGFDASAEWEGRHLGLTSMRERAQSLGADLGIGSDGEGTTVSVELRR